MNAFRTRIVRLAAAATLSATAAGIISITPAGAAAGDPSQWGRSRAATVASIKGDPSQWGLAASHGDVGQLTRKVNEYEGQH